jgi:hypothetical protein
MLSGIWFILQSNPAQAKKHYMWYKIFLSPTKYGVLPTGIRARRSGGNSWKSRSKTGQSRIDARFGFDKITALSRG